MEISVQFDEKQIKAFAAIAAEQLPFATAKALTRLAQDAQAGIRAEMPRRFKVRNQGVIRGVGIKPARKQDWPNAFSVVGHHDSFMVLQETGGKKRPQKGAKQIAVPFEQTIEPQRTAGGKIPPGLKPRRVLATKGGHLQGKTIFLRTGARATKAAKAFGKKTRVALFHLHSDVDIKPRFGFLKTSQEQVQAQYGRRFTEALTDALRTRRR